VRLASAAWGLRRCDTSAAGSRPQIGDENRAGAGPGWRPPHVIQSVGTGGKTLGGLRLCLTGCRSYSPESSLPCGQGTRDPAALHNLPIPYTSRYAEGPDATFQTWLHGW